MKTYIIVQKTSGSINYSVQADSEDEALGLVESGKLGYECHDWDVEETFVDHVEED